MKRVVPWVGAVATTGIGTLAGLIAGIVVGVFVGVGIAMVFHVL